jgi:hypothetical protein
MKTGIAVLSAVAASMIAVTGCGTIHATSVPADGAPATATVTLRQLAASDAATNLASFTAPPGASRIAKVPAGAAAALGQAPLVAGQVDDAAYWQVNGVPATLLNWVRAHLSSHYKLLTSGTEGGFTITPYAVAATFPESARNWYDEFGLPVDGGLRVRVLVVSAAYASASQVVIRVDAQDAWSMTKTTSQRVPATVTAVTIYKARNFGPVMAGDAETVTSPSLVRKIAALVNALPMYATGVTSSCPTELTPLLRILFRNGNSDVATATVNATACGTVSLAIGTKAPVLLGGGGAAFASQVEGLGGLNGVNPGGPMKQAS